MKSILFLCPHGAAKSVMASAYCQHLAQQKGLNVTTQCAGTDPDAEVAPAVAALLQTEGVAITNQPPHAVTTEELAAADYIISLGCDVSHLIPPQTEIIDWSDVPLPSQGLQRSRDMIYEKVQRFVDEL
ncbi:MAG: hypothetical protein AAF485_19825 [Chloroflexota bacterium]